LPDSANFSDREIAIEQGRSARVNEGVLMYRLDPRWAHHSCES
jgi:hypothetical protein